MAPPGAAHHQSLLALPNRRGIQGATTREIARRAGVHGVTLFRDFKSKEQVLRAILKRGLTGKATVMDENSSRKENLRESMEKYGRPYYSHLEKKRLRGRVADGSPILPNSIQVLIADVICPARERLVSRGLRKRPDAERVPKIPRRNFLRPVFTLTSGPAALSLACRSIADYSTRR